MDIQVYRENRSRIPEAELRPYEGQWAAFSGDGSRIVAVSPELEKLHELVKESGEDPETAWFERIIFEDTWQGGLELE